MTTGSYLHQTSFTIKDATALRVRFLILGLFSVALGIAVIILPKMSDFRAETLVGSALMLVGIADVWHALLLLSRRGYMLSLMSSLLFFAIGILILVSPIVDFTSLHIAIGLLFLMGGALRIGKGMDIRPVKNWPWVIASGVLGILFGIYIWGYEGDVLPWATIGLLVGISLIVDGWSRMIVFWVHE